VPSRFKHVKHAEGVSQISGPYAACFISLLASHYQNDVSRWVNKLRLAGNMQSAVDEKKKLELRVDNITGDLNKVKAQAAELEGSKHQLQVGWMGCATHHFCFVRTD
jgi:hypothetical protein